MDKKVFQLIHLTFDSKQDEAQFQVQVTFPEEEQREHERRLAYELLYGVMGNDAYDLESRKQMSLDEKEAHA